MTTWDVVSYRRARRVQVNRKHKHRERWKPKLAKWIMDKYPKYRRYDIWMRDHLRQKAPTATGYGVAYERKQNV